MSVAFEDNIPCFEDLQETFNSAVYTELPADWWVVIADVRDSTQAIQQGRYRDINAVGGGTIAAVLNALKPRQVPYVFGGDGASFCVPPDALPAVKKALGGCQELASEGLGFDLRVGLVPYAELSRPIKVCRYQGAPNLVQYFFMGGGMEEADQLVKLDSRYHLSEQVDAEADFSGFECRWNQVPSGREVTFSLLVKAREQNQQACLELYRSVQQRLLSLMGDVQQHHPLNMGGLSLSFNADKLQAEVATKSLHLGRFRRWRTRQVIRLQNVIGSYWMAFGKRAINVDWGRYKADLVENSDYLKLDDMYRTVMAGDRNAVTQLLQWLEEGYQQGRWYYGCHQTHSAVITCLVSKTGVEHVHFVDSAEGGYAMAAKQIKQQMVVTD
ncbi:MAG: DUF3095 domain-containing protein [Thiomicrorhabdus chilensis]|uniref:DUF3095 domain-containing protein n=1 Tax=Thiomicrorhabdus chilensis TaxID=63656 RepID=UPI0003FA1F12|nr:DUF3095 domain-containing protein [Thiomicrorhabdus chilensis]MDX1347556.1 DUF3095 domain-containing protein [Thiomicrorhabdus chilensis]